MTVHSGTTKIWQSGHEKRLLLPPVAIAATPGDEATPGDDARPEAVPGAEVEAEAEAAPECCVRMWDRMRTSLSAE